MSRAGYRNGQGAMNQGRKCGHMHWPHQEETKALLKCKCVPYLWRHRQSMSCSHVQSHSFSDFMAVLPLVRLSEPAQVNAQHWSMPSTASGREALAGGSPCQGPKTLDAQPASRQCDGREQVPGVPGTPGPAVVGRDGQARGSSAVSSSRVKD